MHFIMKQAYHHCKLDTNSWLHFVLQNIVNTLWMIPYIRFGIKPYHLLIWNDHPGSTNPNLIKYSNLLVFILQERMMNMHHALLHLPPFLLKIPSHFFLILHHGISSIQLLPLSHSYQTSINMIPFPSMLFSNHGHSIWLTPFWLFILEWW